MITKSQLLRKTMRFVSLSMAGALAAWFFLGVSNDSRSQTGLPDSVKDSVIYPQLLSYQPLIEMDECAWLPASTVYAATQRSREEILAARSVAAFPAVSGTTADADRAPRRVLVDDRPTFSAIAVDPLRGEVIVQDENLFQILVYDRLANTPVPAKKSIRRDISNYSRIA